MPPLELRPFRRADRDQLTALVNAHVESVLPGVTVSVNAVLTQLEREPDEPVVDPWAVDRATYVAVDRDRLVAAAHAVRYGTGPEVGQTYRDVAELRWAIGWPESAAALDAVIAAAADGWPVARVTADGALPAPAVYGVPETWPHVAAALERGGFRHGGRVETVLVADVAALPAPAAAPLPGLRTRRVVGGHAPRLLAVLGDDVVGFAEVQADLTAGGALSRLAGWAELWEFEVIDAQRGRGIGTWLLGEVAAWLRLAGARQVLDYAVVGEDDAGAAFLTRRGFAELTRTRVGWERGDRGHRAPSP